MMEDPKTDWKLMKVCPDVGTRWKAAREEIWNSIGRQIGITDGLRSYADQWALWGKGRLKDKNGTWVVCDKKLIVTYAMPGQSYHQYGLAIDSCFLGNDPYLAKLPRGEAEILWELYGKAVKTQGLEWGGGWKIPDRPHCQLTYGLSTHMLQMIYEERGLSGIWEKCKSTMMCGGKSE